ncbi:MAG: hypothetical protein LBE82_05485 [Chitinophagaceae bacterium]|jgi:hypothetical protein|nr:hypothetical protein [Chitinophagaceae bacterium]
MMIINKPVLPMELHINKNFYRKSALGYAGLAIVGVVFFWLGSGKFFTEEYYYPELIVVSSILFIPSTAASILNALQLKNDKPVASLDTQGVRIYGKPFSAVGLIRWQDITGYQEMAEGSRGRKFYLHVKNPGSYIDNIPNPALKRKITKYQKGNGDALVVLNTTPLDVNPATVKTIIANAIAGNQI